MFYFLGATFKQPKESWKFIFSSIAYRIELYLNLLIYGLVWIFSYYIYTMFEGRDLVWLHYSVGVGVDWVDDCSAIFYFPIIGSSFILFNLIWASFLKRHNSFWIHVLICSPLLANFFLLISLCTVYLINFR